jgi:hypothetical protein
VSNEIRILLSQYEEYALEERLMLLIVLAQYLFFEMRV